MSTKYAGQEIRVVTVELCKDETFLILQRPKDAVLGGLWEFPGGRVRRGESDQDALARVLTSLGVGYAPPELRMEVDHPYPDYSVHLSHFRAKVGESSDLPQGRVGVWVAPEDLATYSFPDADQSTVEALLAGEPEEA